MSDKLYRIKPLEWKEPDEDYDMKRGYSPIGDNYYLKLPIPGFKPEWELYISGTGEGGRIWFNTEEEAKSVAQKHYEERLKECLIEVTK